MSQNGLPVSHRYWGQRYAEAETWFRNWRSLCKIYHCRKHAISAENITWKDPLQMLFVTWWGRGYNLQDYADYSFLENGLCRWECLSREWPKLLKAARDTYCSLHLLSYLPHIVERQREAAADTKKEVNRRHERLQNWDRKTVTCRIEAGALPCTPLLQRQRVLPGHFIFFATAWHRRH